MQNLTFHNVSKTVGNSAIVGAFGAYVAYAVCNLNPVVGFISGASAVLITKGLNNCWDTKNSTLQKVAKAATAFFANAAVTAAFCFAAKMPITFAASLVIQSNLIVAAALTLLVSYAFIQAGIWAMGALDLKINSKYIKIDAKNIQIL
jgi:hypothetical protein